MRLEEQVRLLSMVDILEPLSQRQLDALARRVPEHEVEQGKILYSPFLSTTRGSSCSRRGGCGCTG
jgi:hypothetical protein